MAQISNGESGLSARNKLNEVIDKIEGNSAIGNDLTITGNLSFGDGDKAIFGDDNDLQIYHDGSNSRIQDTATGSLILSGTNFYVNNTGDSKSYIAGLAGGTTPYVRLYYDGSTRLDTTLTGIDVTGTVTADGLTVNTTSAVTASFSRDGTDGDAVQIFNGAVGTTKALGLGVDGTHGTINSQYGGVKIQPGGTTSAFFGTGNDISFYDSAGTTAKLQWSASNERLFLSGSDYQFGIGQGANQPWYNRAASDGSYRLHLNGTGDIVTLDSSGNVGIKTSSPSNTLHLSSTSPQIRLEDTDATGYSKVSGASANIYLQADEGNTVADSKIDFRVDGSQRMVIDSDGKLLVGTTHNSLYNTSTQSHAGVLLDGANDNLQIARYQGTTAFFNRLSNDGDIIDFRKNGTTVGSIGTEVTDATLQADLYVHARSTAGGSSLNESRLWLLGGDSGIVLDGYTNAILPTDENSYEDNRTNIGSSDYRFKDLYLSNAVVQAGIKQTTAATTQVVVETFAHASHDGAKVVITAATSADTYVTELLIATNGTTAVATEYGQIGTGSALATYDVDISGADVRILATPASTTSTTFRVAMTLT
jgi:hypothetical protein